VQRSVARRIEDMTDLIVQSKKLSELVIMSHDTAKTEPACPFSTGRRVSPIVYECYQDDNSRITLSARRYPDGSYRLTESHDAYMVNLPQEDGSRVCPLYLPARPTRNSCSSSVLVFGFHLTGQMLCHSRPSMLSYSATTIISWPHSLSPVCAMLFSPWPKRESTLSRRAHLGTKRSVFRSC